MALGLLKYHKPSTPAVRTPARCPVGRARKQIPGCAEDLSIDPALPSPPLCTLGAHVSYPSHLSSVGSVLTHPLHRQGTAPLEDQVSFPNSCRGREPGPLA